MELLLPLKLVSSKSYLNFSIPSNLSSIKILNTCRESAEEATHQMLCIGSAILPQLKHSFTAKYPNVSVESSIISWSKSAPTFQPSCAMDNHLLENVLNFYEVFVIIILIL